MSLEIKPSKCIVLPVKLRSDTGTPIFGLEYFKSLKGQGNPLLKNLQLKTRVENVRFLPWTTFFVGKDGIQSTNKMALMRPRYYRSAGARIRTQNALLLFDIRF